MSVISAGLLLYRIKNGKPEVMLVHPGGPFYAKKDLGCWDVPKGQIHDGEDMLAAAKREFQEETGMEVVQKDFIFLGKVEKPNKEVNIWAFEGDFDVVKLESNTCMVEWPPKSGKKIEIPEVDRAEFFDVETAKTKLYPYLVPIMDMFKEAVK